MKTLDFNYCKEIFNSFLIEQGYSTNTIITKSGYIKYFSLFLSENKLYEIRDITEKEIKDFIKYLTDFTGTKTNTNLKTSTKNGILTALNLFFRCLCLKEKILVNPFQRLDFRFKQKKVEKKIFTESQINHFLDNIDISNTLGLRDRCIFELIYSSGLRRSEVVKIDIEDIDFSEGVILLKKAKFSKDRVVPVNDVTKYYLAKYLSGRLDKKNEPVFMGQYGRLSSDYIGQLFRKHLKQSGIKDNDLTCHSIRHSTATHILEHGANIRYVQELLGHESIETTAVYTHILYDNLKRIYKTYHPKENKYYCEVDYEYLANIEKFKTELERQKRIRDRDRETKKKHYLNKRIH